MEQFYNANKIPFSKVYLRITGINSEIKSARSIIKQRYSKSRIIVKSNSKESTTSLETLSNDNLLFKVRSIYLKNALPIYMQSVKNILERSWKSKLDTKLFEEQNGLRVLVSIVESSHHLTNLNEEVFGYKYIVSINGQDPEFMGVGEPTNEDYTRETLGEQLQSVEFCPFNAYEVDRVYLTSNSSSYEELQTKINEILIQAWNSLNQDLKEVPQDRIVAKYKLIDGYFTIQKEKAYRLEMTYLVDGGAPNPIRFTKPSLQDITPLLTNAGINIYEGIPLISQSISILSYNISFNDLLESSIKKAFSEANPSLKDDRLVVKLENVESVNKPGEKQTKRDVNSGAQFEIKYTIGVNDDKFDSSEITNPSWRIIKQEIKSQIPGVSFEDDLFNTDAIEQSRSNVQKTVSFEILNN